MLYAYEKEGALQLDSLYETDTNNLLYDSSGEMLFKFADADLESFSDLFLCYIGEHIDTASLQCREGDPGKARDLFDALSQLHPFFLSCDHMTALPDMLASSLNQLIKDKKCGRAEYEKLLMHLCATPLDLCLEHDGYPVSRHDRRLFLVKNYEEYANSESPAVQSQWKRTGINGLISLQQYVRSYMYWVLDYSAMRFSGLDIDGRLRLFAAVFGAVNIWQPLSLKEMSCIGIPVADSISALLHRGQWELLQNPGETESVPESIKSKVQNAAVRNAYSDTLIGLDSDAADMDPELGRYLKAQIESIKKETSAPLFKAYEISCFSDYILLQLRLLTERKTLIKRCKHCHRYFITERANIDYCQRILPGETQTCYVIGPRRVFNKNLSSDLPRGLYSKAYKKYQGRLRRKTITESQFEDWKAEAKKLLGEVQNGKISLDEYKAWMEQ